MENCSGKWLTLIKNLSTQKKDVEEKIFEETVADLDKFLLLKL